MKWVLIIGLLWLSMGVVIGVPLGWAIRTADRIDEGLDRLTRPAPPVPMAVEADHETSPEPPRLRLVGPRPHDGAVHPPQAP